MTKSITAWYAEAARSVSQDGTYMNFVPMVSLEPPGTDTHPKAFRNLTQLVPAVDVQHMLPPPIINMTVYDRETIQGLRTKLSNIARDAIALGVTELAQPVSQASSLLKVLEDLIMDVKENDNAEA